MGGIDTPDLAIAVARSGVFTALVNTLRDWLGRQSGRHAQRDKSREVCPRRSRTVGGFRRMPAVGNFHPQHLLVETLIRGCVDTMFNMPGVHVFDAGWRDRSSWAAPRSQGG
jgi:hypothetical protein